VCFVTYTFHSGIKTSQGLILQNPGMYQASSECLYCWLEHSSYLYVVTDALVSYLWLLCLSYSYQETELVCLQLVCACVILCVYTHIWDFFCHYAMIMLYEENMKHKIKVAFCSLYLKQYCVALCAQLFPD
jgi:hypothetical protein